MQDLFKKETHTLNRYQINILQILAYMQKVKDATNPRVFFSTFKEIEHKYPTRFSKFSFKQPPALLNYGNFSIFSRGPLLWNNILSEKKPSEIN